MQSLRNLFTLLLRDLYGAEQELQQAMAKMEETVSSADLSAVITDHGEETATRLARLEKIFSTLGMTPDAKPSMGMLGILSEMDEVTQLAERETVFDAGLLAVLQTAKHYGMARYGTLLAWANQLKMEEIAHLLSQSLEEEKAADRHLSEIAERSVNEEAHSTALTDLGESSTQPSGQGAASKHHNLN